MGKTLWKGSTLLAPLPPVLVTCVGAQGDTNILTVAWTGIVSSHPPRTYISLKPERYSHKLITETGKFVINLPTDDLAFAVDYCGVKSGTRHNKFADLNLEYEPSPVLACPLLCKSPIGLECRVLKTDPMGSHDMFLADILGVLVDERIIENGKLQVEKAGLIAFAHGSYYALGKCLGNFGFSVMKRNTSKRKRRRHANT